MSRSETGRVISCGMTIPTRSAWDVDARWTKKRDETLRLQADTKVEKRNKIILSYDTTSAEVHDSKGFEGLLDGKAEQDLYLDASYIGRGDCKTA